MEPALLALNGWLEAAGLVEWARGGTHVYPWANVLHVLGVVMLLGGIGVLDARIAGAWKQLPLDALSRALTPVAIAGLAVQSASGLVLFAADGVALAASRTFHWKLGLLALGLLNAVVFHYRWRKLANGGPPMPDLPARAAALLSLGVWIAVAVAGRLIAYY